jgi:8-oxo-dGTP pyrophosphatase MutT (NUDIX family)
MSVRYFLHCWPKVKCLVFGSRVDAGEGFETGAVREALEEAGTVLEQLCSLALRCRVGSTFAGGLGVPVTLTGILRIEHTPGMKYAGSSAA